MAPDETPLIETNVLYDRKRMDLVIKECPANIAKDFFDFAAGKWNKKQWVALQDLLQIARAHQSMMEMSERVDALESVVASHEAVLSHVTISIPAPQKEEVEEKPADKKPRTFGGNDG